jgi:hypothetical protein
VHLPDRFQAPGLAAGLLAGLLATLLTSGGADAGASVNRAQANAIAVRVLRPQADKGEVILFGLPKPLPAGTVVAPADPPRGDPTRKARVRGQRLTAPSWLYWLDRDPYARFSHESEYLLVDDRTGRVVHRSKIGWYPTIGGKDPAFLSQAGYEARQHRVFARSHRSGRHRSPAPSARALSCRAFASDCVLMVGDYSTARCERLPAVDRWAKSVKLRSYYATPPARRALPARRPTLRPCEPA